MKSNHLLDRNPHSRARLQRLGSLSLAATSVLWVACGQPAGDAPEAGAGAVVQALAAPAAAPSVGGLPCPVLYQHFDQCQDGTYRGPDAVGTVTCGAGRFGSALAFPGDTTAIEVPDRPEFHVTDRLTLSAWVNPSTVAGTNTIINKWYFLDSYMLLVADGKFEFRLAFPDGSYGTQAVVAAPATAGTWTHVAGVYDGAQMRLYLNGVLAASAPQAGAVQDSTRPLAIGNHPAWNAFDGLIDEVRLYDVALSGDEVSGLAALDATPQALMLVDPRLYGEARADIDAYRCAAEARRDFPIALHDVVGIDDMEPADVKAYLSAQRAATGATSPRLEGALFLGNIRIPAFCLDYGWTIEHGLIPSYYEDLDASYTRDNPAPGCPEPFDFSEITPGPNAGPELWSAFMPVGYADPALNTYPQYAAQLKNALNKATAYAGWQTPAEKRFYQVSNQLWYGLGTSWDYYGASGIDFYSMNPDLAGTVPPETPAHEYCLRNGRSPADCYVRAATETYATFADFWQAYVSREWMGENWQVPEIYLPHMASHRYEFVWVNTHANEYWSLISSDQARTMTGGGIVMTGSGCDVGRFSQPHPEASVSGAFANENILASYVYGSSSFVAATGTTFTRQWEPAFAELVELTHELGYLGAAYLENRRSRGMSQLEILIGDPFVSFEAPSCDDGYLNGLETAVDCGGTCAPCGTGEACGTFGDCASATCVGGTCVEPAATVNATVTVTNDWGSGYCANVVVTNPGSTSTGDWHVDIALPGATLANAWNATTQALVGTATVRFSAMPYNATLAPGAATTAGFCASRQSGTAAPSVAAASGTAPSVNAAATATLTLPSNWGAGYCAELVVTNPSSSPVTDWAVLVDVGDSTVTGTWNLTDAALGGAVHRLTPVAHNATLWPGGSTSIGYCATKTGPAFPPTVVGVASR